MTRFNSQVTNVMIRKIHDMLLDVESGEEVLDYLRDTEPLFMKEVARFVEYEMEKLEKDNIKNENTIMYIGSALGAAYVMGFLIARELDHSLYKGVLDIDSVFDNIDFKSLGKKQIKESIDDKIDNSLKKTFFKKKKKPKSKKSKKDLNIDFNEEEL